MARRTLHITSGPAAGRTIDIDHEVVLGREGVEVAIQDPELSRRHVAFRPARDGVEVEDLGSLNGTFVNGRKLSGPETLRETSELKLGTSEATVEIPKPEPQIAADVTAPRQVAQPDVTAPRQVAQPGAPAAGPVADPDVTAPRQVAQPDVTAPRRVADPDVTVQRPAERQGPPGGPSPPAPPEDPGKGRGGPPVLLIVGGLLALAAIVVALILLAGGGDEAKARTLRVHHEVTTPTAEDKRKSELPPGKEAITWTLTGETSGRPFGKGNITAIPTIHPVGPPPGAKGKKPPPGAGGAKKALVTVRITVTFPNGSIKASERLNNKRIGNRIVVTGRGRILSGTGDFEGAKGTFDVTGERPNFFESFETVDWKGTVTY